MKAVKTQVNGVEKVLNYTGTTYMAPAEFTERCVRLFGQFWQKEGAIVLGYERNMMRRYGNGERAVPATVAHLMILLCEQLDRGVPVFALKPAGTLDDGIFRATPQVTV